ncbi:MULTISPECIES: DUF3060 domain-containing protein [Sphingobacterium]|jgi:Protein of unknown function (DUF3060)|uniref:DUF3060 domain-containing protein n=1 Tax=Sphingobacterium multivorum TaxID=28454 RepID=A0A654DRC4_SPHMU|nr:MULTISPECIES: DUF3060 domain-containing protein [Sphingobacterium]HAE66858.1 hypothetical protein [Sphingobacterium sp.]MDF2853317.1 hypothetical protein [Sphingobacterium multivorum]OJZ13976.1 MAG: hypothetical protein BGP15_06335 [Sphingobacterium sp. 40-24]QQT46523.1 DUF3060 domain-containing protein [Sphingobacterium multivorum]QQT60870.1 DUF3060 domain-containing protein [Sphingobacterium multivorum]
MKLRTITFGFSLLLIGSLVIAAKEPFSKALTNDVVNQQGKVISIEGVNNNRTIEAKGGEIVQIEGADNKVVIRGNVSKLIIEGKGNTVTGNDIATVTIEGADNMVNIGSVETVQIEGVKNHVHYKSTKNKSGQVKVSTEGADNMVMKMK